MIKYGTTALYAHLVINPIANLIFQKETAILLIIVIFAYVGYTKAAALSTHWIMQ